MPFDQFRWFGVTYEEARTGCYNGAARLADMDIDGVDAEVLFPPQRTMSHFLGDDDDDFVLAGVEAYNNFLFEEFCAADPTRLIGLAQIPSLGIDTAVDALRKAKARGAKGVIISNWPSGGESLSTDDDPFWAAAVDEGIPVSIHINIISRRQRVGGAQGRGEAGQRAVRHGQRGRARQGDRRDEPRVLDDGRHHDLDALHAACSTASRSCRSAGSRPASAGSRTCIESIDDRYWRNRVWGELSIKNPPSFYWYRNNAASFITDRSGIALRHAVGVDNMMWSSDYPHHGNDWPYSRKVIEETMGHIPAARAGQDHRRQRGPHLAPRRLGPTRRAGSGDSRRRMRGVGLGQRRRARSRRGRGAASCGGARSRRCAASAGASSVGVLAGERLELRELVAAPSRSCRRPPNRSTTWRCVASMPSA